MTWISTVDPLGAEGALAELYDAIASSRGGVANVHRAQSLHPRAMKAHLELYKSIVFARSSLDRIARERIAVVVSHANRCPYCVGHHAEALAQLGDDPSVLEPLRRGVLAEALDAPARALLEWARRGALSPSEASREDVERLRELGFDDRAILDATLTVAYFSFVNRLVLLLGVDLEEDYERTCGDDAAERG